MKCNLIFFALLFAVAARGQTSYFTIPSSVYLPKDTTVKKLLTTSLNGFLAQKENPNKENTFVLNGDLLETSVLIDEMKNISPSKKYNDTNFYKGYLTTALKLNDSLYLIQLAYIGITEGAPLVRANFTLEAIKRGSQFYFRSPLRQNTIGWKTEEIGNTKIHFKTTINSVKAKEYLQMVSKYDKKLSAKDTKTEYYSCDNFHEVLQLIGVDYKSDYSNIAHNTLTAKENNTSLCVNGSFTPDFTNVDPHDLWHERLHNVLSTDIINRPVDEGTAYLYGGSWGLTWEQILDKFRAFAHENPKADWLSLYNESKNFDEKAKYPLNVDFVINALLVQKIEKENGFPAVIELLSCGKKEAGNENYFNALKKITGIDKANFNKNVLQLMN